MSEIQEFLTDSNGQRKIRIAGKSRGCKTQSINNRQGLRRERESERYEVIKKCKVVTESTTRNEGLNIT